MAVLLGGQARSLALIVAVFLLGLALGCYCFGHLAQRIKNRHKLLKFYGLVELSTGIYGIIFPSIFLFFLESSLAQTNHLGVHFLLTTLLLILPTFLMGATVPVMATVLPEKGEKINSLHSLIYGTNTLGAFAGTILIGLYLLPLWGHHLTLTILAILNIFISFIYIKNNLLGLTHQKSPPPVLPHSFKPFSIYTLSALSGTIILGLEILWFRISALTIGNSLVVFPFVLSIFVLMVGLGAITIRKMDLPSLQKSLFYGLIFALLAFLTVPYLPLFISNIRVSFTAYPYAFYFFHFLVYLILLAIMAPSIFYLSRILPYTYSMLAKNSNNYGLKVGYLYFFNTLGTVVGCLVPGYLLFHLFSLQTIYLIILALLLFSALYFLRGRIIFQVLCLVSTIVVALVPFSRKYHSIGLFRERVATVKNFKNIIGQTNASEKNRTKLYFADGPNATVSVLKYKNDSKSVVINGKSDGNTVGDYSTVTLLSLIPYLSQDKKELKTMNIGIGTGISAGVLTLAEEVSLVDVVEISSAVIKSVPFLAPENFNFQQSPKTNIVEMDAFQFLKVSKEKYDIIVSEPSNPWVVGIENLYTPYFYKLVKEKLTPNGVLSQWLHTYSVTGEINISILANLKKHFRRVVIFRVGKRDMAIFADNRSGPFVVPHKKLIPPLQKILSNIGLERSDDLNFYLAYNSRETSAIVQTRFFFDHQIFHPKLNTRAYFSFYSGKGMEWPLLEEKYRRILPQEKHLRPSLNRLKQILAQTNCDETRKYISFPCHFLVPQYQVALKDIDSPLVGKRMVAYSTLRSGDFIEKELSFLTKAMDNLPSLSAKKEVREISDLIIKELIRDGEIILAKSTIKRLQAKEFFYEEEARELIEKSKHIEKMQQKLKVQMSREF